MKKQIDHVAEFHDVFQIGNELSPKVDVGSEVYYGADGFGSPPVPQTYLT